MIIRGDVKDASFCKKAVEKTMTRFSRLDVLVNNAAFQVHTADIEDLTNEHFDETLKTNLYGYFYMAKAAIPHLNNGLRHHQHGLRHRPGRIERAARLFDDQRRDPCLHEGPF